MIVEYIRYRIPEDEAAAFENAYRRATESLEASPHCERYEVARCTAAVRPYVDRIEEMRHYDVPTAGPNYVDLGGAARHARGACHGHRASAL